MATRSTIAMKTEDGKVRAIYCHWDGYIAYNGKMLMGEYTDPAKVKQLIDLGDISSLRKDIGEKHPFDRNHEEPELEIYEDWCMAYHRDRGEEWARVAPKTYDTVGDWVEGYGDSWVEYFYLFDGRDWLVNKYSEKDDNGFPIFDYVEVEALKEIVN
jgi:hypothetical protein